MGQEGGKTKLLHLIQWKCRRLVNDCVSSLSLDNNLRNGNEFIIILVDHLCIYVCIYIPDNIMTFKTWPSFNATMWVNFQSSPFNNYAFLLNFACWLRCSLGKYDKSAEKINGANGAFRVKSKYRYSPPVRPCSRSAACKTRVWKRRNR